MLDGLAWTHYWQRQSTVRFLLHPVPHAQWTSIAHFSLHANMPRVCLDLYASASSFSKFRPGLNQEAGGKRALGWSIEISDSRREEYPADSHEEKASGGAIGSARWAQRNVRVMRVRADRNSVERIRCPHLRQARHIHPSTIILTSCPWRPVI